MQLEPLRHSETLKNTFARQKDEKRQNTCKFQTLYLHTCIWSVSDDSVFYRNRVFFSFFFRCERKCTRSIYTAVGHSSRSGSSASLAGRAPGRKGFYWARKTQINCALNQINAHLKWAVSPNSLRMSTYNPFELSTQAITPHSSTLYARVCHKQRWRRRHVIRRFLF